MKADTKTQAEIVDVLERFKNSVAARDLSGVLRLFADDSDVFLLGSEASEKALGPSQLKSFFEGLLSQPVVYVFEWKSYSISNSGSVGWAAIDALIHMKGGGRDAKAPYRITVVLEKRKDRWFLMQFHGSEPVKA